MSKTTLPPYGFQDCEGQAHDPEVVQDYCMVCMPNWGRYPVCPTCVSPDDANRHVRLITRGKSGSLKRPFCPKCNKKYTSP